VRTRIDVSAAPLVSLRTGDSRADELRYLDPDHFTHVAGQALSISLLLFENALPPLGQATCAAMLAQPIP
jgi:hypothetical protein